MKPSLPRIVLLLSGLAVLSTTFRCKADVILTWTPPVRQKAQMLKKIMLLTFIVLGLMAPKPAWATPISLWASSSDSSTNSRSSTLFELDPTTGAVLSSIPGPGDNADALAFTNDGKVIWVLDSSFDNQDDSYVYRVDLAGNVVQRLYVHLNAEGLTVLQDNTLVIGAGSVIAFVDPLTGEINSRFSVHDVFGLASNGVDRIYGLQPNGIIDTYDLVGNLLGSLTTGVTTGVEGATLGLTFTGEFFYVSSSGSSSTIFQVNSAGKGIDGRLYCHEFEGGPTKQVIFSVKAGTHIMPAHVSELRGVIEREKAALGVLITMHPPTRAMKVEAASAGSYASPWGKHPRIQILTVDQLLKGEGIDYPPARQASVTYKPSPLSEDTTRQLSLFESGATKRQVSMKAPLFESLRPAKKGKKRA